MKNKFIKFSVIMIVLMMQLPAFASESPVTTIVKLGIVYYDSTPDVYIDLADSPTGQPSCHAGVNGWDYLLDISTAPGRSAYATLLSAQAQNKRVKIYGLDVCSMAPNTTEDAGTIFLYTQ